LAPQQYVRHQVHRLRPGLVKLHGAYHQDVHGDYRKGDNTLCGTTLSTILDHDVFPGPAILNSTTSRDDITHACRAPGAVLLSDHRTHTPNLLATDTPRRTLPAKVSGASSSATSSVSGTRIFDQMSILRPWRWWSRVSAFAKFFLKVWITASKQASFKCAVQSKPYRGMGRSSFLRMTVGPMSSPTGRLRRERGSKRTAS
jgi:hypothetical protein